MLSGTTRARAGSWLSLMRQFIHPNQTQLAKSIVKRQQSSTLFLFGAVFSHKVSSRTVMIQKDLCVDFVQLTLPGTTVDERNIAPVNR